MVLDIIRSNEGLDDVVLNRFMIRHTNEDVHLAYFKIDKEAEKVARAHVDEWLPMFLKGARLIETTWYPVKVDYIPKIEATDHQTRAISQETREAFAEENEVEVKLMRWLGRPKEHAAYASALVKLATKEQVEKLLQKQALGEDVELFGCMANLGAAIAGKDTQRTARVHSTFFKQICTGAQEFRMPYITTQTSGTLTPFLYKNHTIGK
ncbi:hypothetical protein KCU95_g27, partial [Aureobasidium melanogenum]